MRKAYVLLTAMLILAGMAQAASRKWTSADGKFTVQAELVAVKDEMAEAAQGQRRHHPSPGGETQRGGSRVRHRELRPAGRR